MTTARTGALGLAFLLTSCVSAFPPVGQAPREPATSTPPVSTNVEGDVHRLINAHRAQAGLPPLRYDEGIAAVARQHSGAMAGKTRAFGHDGFDGRAAAVNQIVSVGSFAENVAYNSRSGADLAPSVVTGWIASSGHRRNIEGAFTLTGIGAARSLDGVTYVTQLFVRPPR